MKQFSILRYIRQFSLLILLIALVGSVAIYRYGQSKQRYVASAVIRYTNVGAKDGYTPDGSPLNVEEIYSSTVIDAALRDLGYEANVDSIRSNCYVEEVIPEDQQKLSEVLLEKGEESTYTPDTYRVVFVGGNTTSGGYAWNVLDAIIKNYCEFYTEKYVEEQLQDNAASALSQGNYDFIESVQILDDAVSRMLDYLLSQRSARPYFRSIETGYTYSDLYDIYDLIYNYEIPTLYATILGNAESDDIEVLKNRMTKDCEDLELSIENRRQRAEHLKGLIDTYSDRNKEMMDYHYHNSNNQESGSEYILKDVEYDREYNDKETTYDSLIQEYVTLNISIRQSELDLEHDRYLLGVFDAAIGAQNRQIRSSEEIQGMIDRCAQLFTEYYQYVEQTGRELNRYLSADYLTMVSSINVSEEVNLKLYLIIALALFTVVGVAGAILLGRMLDFIDYFLYVDKAVGLPNRARCDVYIGEKADRLLERDFSCLAIRMDSLSDISRSYGRATGDAVLKDFAQIIKSFGDLYGFVGHNGGGNFIAFFPNCPGNKVDVILQAIDRQVAEYNKRTPGQEIRYSSGKAVSDVDGTFEIRQLLRLAMQRMNPAKAD